MNYRPTLIRALCLAVVAAIGTNASAATIAIANWNVENAPSIRPADAPADNANLRTILRHIGTVAGRALDLLGLAETDTDSIAPTLAALQDAYTTPAGVPAYASVISNFDVGGDRTGFFYNTATLGLLGSIELAGGDLEHRIIRAHFQPVGGRANTDFYAYSVHLKSASGTAEREQRSREAQQLRVDADALGVANVLFVGDFNWLGADERGTAGISAYEVFNAAGAGQVFDAINQVGEWTDNLAFKGVHTQDPGGAMDDRFDMQLISDELRDGAGIDYLTGSYGVIGNNNTHALNGLITTGTGAPSDVLSALAAFSDHLPVLAQYTYVVPEPGTMMIVAAAGIVIGRRRR